MIDVADADSAAAIEALGMRVLIAPTVMRFEEDRERLAAQVLTFSAG